MGYYNISELDTICRSDCQEEDGCKMSNDYVTMHVILTLANLYGCLIGIIMLCKFIYLFIYLFFSITWSWCYECGIRMIGGKYY